MGTTTDKRKSYRTRWYQKHPKYWFKRGRERPAGRRRELEVVRIGPGAADGRPPVRIFLGTEPMQARAERVFVWSVKQFADPTRNYEIHLMKDLEGFERDSWTTGFTNYRYAIPYLAGGRGKAIYNDVDQIYLHDPSEMFDLDMQGKAILIVEQGETSVSLFDCAQMATWWKVEEARTPLKRKHFLDIIDRERLWGVLPAQWNARDNEFTAKDAKCFHFTTLRTQPWRPFPDQLRYEPHPEGEAWFALERSADEARFNAFSREIPSSRFAEAVARGGNGAPSGAGDEKRHDAEIAKLASATGAKTALDCSAPASGGARAWRGLTVTQSPRAPFAEPVTGRFDGVAAIDSVSRLPEEDIPWALDELFAAADRFVYVAVVCDAERVVGAGAPLPADWWRLQMELAANRTPGRRWRLAVSNGAGAKAQIHGASTDEAAAA